jgi:hypothetical protein
LAGAINVDSLLKVLASGENNARVEKYQHGSPGSVEIIISLKAQQQQQPSWRARDLANCRAILKNDHHWRSPSVLAASFRRSTSDLAYLNSKMSYAASKSSPNSN